MHWCHKMSAAKDDNHITSNILWLPEMQAPYMQGQRLTLTAHLIGNLPFPQCHKVFPSPYQEELMYFFYLVYLANFSTLPAQRTDLCGSFKWCFWWKHGFQRDSWLTLAVLTPGILEQLPPRFTALAIEKWDLLLLFNILLLFRSDICDQQISGTCRFVLRFLLISLVYR